MPRQGYWPDAVVNSATSGLGQDEGAIEVAAIASSTKQQVEGFGPTFPKPSLDLTS
jgi:hypothetical protein